MQQKTGTSLQKHNASFTGLVLLMQMMKFLIQAQQGCLEKTAGFREWLWIGSKLWRLQSAPASSLLSL
jgi:hypothetical protein